MGQGTTVRRWLSIGGMVLAVVAILMQATGIGSGFAQYFSDGGVILIGVSVLVYP